MKENDYSVSHYIFDFDGTLVDSMPYWGKTMVKLLDENGVKYPDNIINIITPMGLKNSCRYLAEEFQLPGGEKAVLQTVFADMTVLYREVIRAKKGVADKLKELKEQGKGLHVLTASPHIWVDACLKNNGILDLFDDVWTFEDFDTPKTDPETYKDAVKRIRTTLNEVAFLDDNIGACRAAKESGIVTIGVFDETSKNDRPLFMKTCDAYIDGFDEL